MNAINEKRDSERFAGVANLAFIGMAIAIMLFFILLVISAPSDFNELLMPWLNPILGPFGFLRGGHWAREAWKETVVFFLVLAGLVCAFYRNVYVRGILFLLFVFCWSAIGFISFLIYGGDR